MSDDIRKRITKVLDVMTKHANRTDICLAEIEGLLYVKLRKMPIHALSWPNMTLSIIEALDKKDLFDKIESRKSNVCRFQKAI